MRVSSVSGLAGLLFIANSSLAQDDGPSPEDVTNRTRPIVDHILGIYNDTSDSSSGFIPGLFGSSGDPYYFWEAGLAFDTLTRYWAVSEDDSVVGIISQALLFQVGPDYNYMPLNQSKNLGNDDQSSWGLAAMTAAEHGLPMPEGANATWFQLADAVFNGQVLRWDDESCGGGIKWQIFSFNVGYNYKNTNTLSNFAYLASRLYRYTRNETYNEWAMKAYQWTIDVGFLDLDTDAVFDGADDITNCSSVNRVQWTINVGQFMNAASYACNVSCTDEWRTLSNAMISSVTRYFAPENESYVIEEIACARSDNCNTDQLAFKAPLSRALGNLKDLIPDFNNTDVLGQVIVNSAQGAFRACSSDGSAAQCGSDWRGNNTEVDRKGGLGQDLAALEIIMAAVPGKQLLTADTTPGGNTSANSTTGGENGTDTGSVPTETTDGSGASSLMASSSSLTSMTALVMGALFVFF